MEQEMFCFQCEQAANCAGCTGRAGVCGKTSETARLQDRLTGALIGLARVSNGEAHLAEDVCRLMIRALFATLTNVNFDPRPWGSSSTWSTGSRSGWAPAAPSAVRPAAGRRTMT